VNRVWRVGLAVMVLASSVVAVGGGSAGASTASGSKFTVWPWAVPSGGTQPVGGVCAMRAWSVASGGAISQSFTWDNTHDGQMNFNCDIITQPGQHVNSTGACAVDSSVYAVLHLHELGGDIFNATCSAGASPAQLSWESSTGTATTVVHNYHGSTSDWVHFNGQITFIAGCQFGGSASNATCGGSHSSSANKTLVDTTWAGNPEARGDAGHTGSCVPPTGDPTVNGSGSFMNFAPNSNNVPTAIKCYIESGTNEPAYPPTPDGSPPPTGTPSCSFGVMTYALNNYSGLSDMAGVNNSFYLRQGDSVTFTSAFTYSGAFPTLAQVEIRRVDGKQDPKVSDVFTPGASGADVHYTFTGDSSTDYLYIFAFQAVVGSATCERDWDSNAVDQYHGPVGGGPVDGCVSNCVPVPDGGRDASFGACFSGIWYSVEFFGLASFPWMHITELPGDSLCAIKVLVLPRETFAALFSNSIDAVGTSVIGQAGATIIDIGAGFTGFVSAAASGGSCSGLGVDDGAGHTVYPADSCGSSAPGYAVLIVGVAVAMSGGFWIWSIGKRLFS
jgi:hypothetical protein